MADEQALQQFFDFDAEDLAANRSGKLTDKQRKYISEDARYNTIIGIGCGAVAYAVAAATLIPALVAGVSALETHGASNPLQHLDFNLTITVIFLALGSYMIYWGLSRARGEKNFVLKRAMGPANIVAVERRTDLHHPVYVAHELHIADLTVDVKDDFANYVQQGAHLAVYYVEAPGGGEKQVLSVEQLPGNG